MFVEDSFFNSLISAHNDIDSDHEPSDVAISRFALQVELNTLCQREHRAVVDSARGATAVLLPGVGAGLATSAGLLLASEGTANLGAGSADVAVDETTV